MEEVQRKKSQRWRGGLGRSEIEARVVKEA
jgi:hypothetical protein